MYDEYNDEEIVLSKEEMRMIQRIRQGAPAVDGCTKLGWRCVQVVVHCCCCRWRACWPLYGSAVDAPLPSQSVPVLQASSHT